jgi:hypothetical protein
MLIHLKLRYIRAIVYKLYHPCIVQIYLCQKTLKAFSITCFMKWEMNETHMEAREMFTKL